MWLHVDAAWAGVTLACPEYREIAQLPGINEYTDSICISLHKVIHSVRTRFYCYVILAKVGPDKSRRICSLGA